MADIFNLPNCGGSTSTLNTGFPLCDVIRKAPKALFLLDAGVEFTSANAATIASFVAAFKAATRAARGSRVFPILSLTDFADNSKAPTKASLGNLSIQEITMQQGIPAFTFKHRKGDLYHQQLTAAQNANVTLMILDDAYVLYGTKTAGGNMTGFSLAEFYVELAKFATAANPSEYPFSVVLNSITEYKENLLFLQLDATVLNVSGNRDITLTVATQAANIANISVIGRGGKNLGDLYPVELAAIAAWTLVNTQTSAAVTITSVTYNSTLKQYVFTADSTAYTALTSGQKFTVNLVNPAPLSALGVDGFESLGPVYITKP